MGSGAMHYGIKWRCCSACYVTNKNWSSPRFAPQRKTLWTSILHKPLTTFVFNLNNSTEISCSVMAALIVTVAFASCATVPDGTNINMANQSSYTIPHSNSLSLLYWVLSVSSSPPWSPSLPYPHLVTKREILEKNLSRKFLISLTSLFMSIALYFMFLGWE